MTAKNFPTRLLGLTAATLCVVSCSRGPASPSARPDEAARGGGLAQAVLTPSIGGGQALVQASAAGDVTNGPIEILNIRVRPLGSNTFYAFPNGVYNLAARQEVELWVEWKANKVLSDAPRLVIHWDLDRESDKDNIHCGPCLLTHTYLEGVYKVSVVLDDREGGVTSRTFKFDVSAVQPPPRISVSATYLTGSIRTGFEQTPLPPTLPSGGLRNPLVVTTVKVTAQDGDGDPLPFVLESAECVNCERNFPGYAGFPNFTFDIGTPDVHWTVLRLTKPPIGPDQQPVSYTVVYATTDSLGRKARASLNLTIVPD